MGTSGLDSYFLSPTGAILRFLVAISRTVYQPVILLTMSISVVWQAAISYQSVDFSSKLFWPTSWGVLATTGLSQPISLTARHCLIQVQPFPPLWALMS